MPTVNIVASSSYGYVGGKNATYSTARSTSTESATTSIFVGQGENPSATEFEVYRGFVKFDLSSVPAGAQITAVTMTLTAITDQSGTDFDLNIVRYDWSGQDPISAGNRETAFDGNLAATVDAVWRNSSGMSTNTPYTSPALSTSYPVVGQTVFYGFNSARDVANTTPTTNVREFVELADADDATQAYRPTLNVTYSLIGGTSTTTGTASASASILANRVFSLDIPKTSFTISNYRS